MQNNIYFSRKQNPRHQLRISDIQWHSKIRTYFPWILHIHLSAVLSVGRSQGQVYEAYVDRRSADLPSAGDPPPSPSSTNVNNTPVRNVVDNEIFLIKDYKNNYRIHSGIGAVVSFFSFRNSQYCFLKIIFLPIPTIETRYYGE